MTVHKHRDILKESIEAHDQRFQLSDNLAKNLIDGIINNQNIEIILSYEKIKIWQ
jgi:hypothetical protein